MVLSEANLHSFLVDVAAKKETITYGNLAEAFGVPLRELRSLLDPVSRISEREKQVMLPAIVVRQDTKVPGKGFFTAARERGKKFSDEKAFWEAECERVFAAYAPPSPKEASA